MVMVKALLTITEPAKELSGIPTASTRGEAGS
jgi:hypothetical protein